LFSYALLNNPTDIFIERGEIVMRSGSHHFILYTFQEGTPSLIIPPPNVIRDIRDQNGNYIRENLLPMQFHKFVAGTQWPRINYHFPPGVALRLPAGAGIDMNSHYANRSSETIQGEIYANLHLVDSSEVKYVAEIFSLNNFDILLPPQQVTTLTKTFIFSERRHIFQLISHAHEHMVQFNVEMVGGPRDGELVYVAYDWEHPPILQIDPPLVLEPGQGMKLIVTYNNQTNRTIRFGLLSEDEMMILFGYYYIPPPTAVENRESPELPQSFALEQNYPNPFNPETTIRYGLPHSAEIDLAVYDVSGKLVTRLMQGKQTAGNYSLVWHAGNLASGMYFVRLTAGQFQVTRKVLLLR
jgi:hypothetical protein